MPVSLGAAKGQKGTIELVKGSTVSRTERIILIVGGRLGWA